VYDMTIAVEPCPICGDMDAPRVRGSLWCVECTDLELVRQAEDEAEPFVTKQLFVGRLEAHD